jgi:hypothetical protein
VDGDLWWESDTGNLYVYYDDGSTQQWVQVNGPVAAAGTAEARNRMVNGAFQLTQENGQTAGGTNLYYFADQWFLAFVGAGAVVSSVHVTSTTPKGTPYRSRISVTTAKASLAAGDYLAFVQRIEGVMVADNKWGTAAARQMILRFGFKGPAGTYAVSLRNSGAVDRTFIGSFTISAGQANTDTEQVIVIPGDVTGTWAIGAVSAIDLWVTLASGTTWLGSAEGWQAGNFVGKTGQTNGLGTAGNTFELFDVGLYMDPNNTGVPPPWELPDYNAELLTCQRYWQKVRVEFSGNVTSGQTYYARMQVTPVMRTNPTAAGTNASVGNFPATVGTAFAVSYTLAESRVASGTGTGRFVTDWDLSARM